MGANINVPVDDKTFDKWRMLKIALKAKDGTETLTKIIEMACDNLGVKEISANV